MRYQDPGSDMQSLLDSGYQKNTRYCHNGQIPLVAMGSWSVTISTRVNEIVSGLEGRAQGMEYLLIVIS